ncbi:MAG TPA: carboxypeptidase-like regulatory domain-containing protein [Opitutaceae bacterium]|jgi:hypothetical protein|nr:carboxypeptidase-like regulatory domain-containing protein [Opitutaceae bacterium]
MNKKNVSVMAIILIIAMLLLWYWAHRKTTVSPPQETAAANLPSSKTAEPAEARPTTSQSSQASHGQLSSKDAEEERLKKVAAEKKIWDALLLTPINFYGKVVDEKGHSIPEANVSISFADTPWEGHTKITEKTDDSGMFHVIGHGLGIVIQVSKAGYYHLKQSDGNFGYSKAGGPIDPHPDAAEPAIFVLRKIGSPVKLIQLERDYSISKDGKPVEISLTTGKQVLGGQGDIKVEAWTYDQGHQTNSNLPYDWHCRISVSDGGGLIARTSEFDFEAPVDGYVTSDEINMPASGVSKWRSQVSREYFMKLSGDRYARMKFEMTAGGDHFFGIESYLNPSSGDRNLEFDPAQAIKPDSGTQ